MRMIEEYNRSAEPLLRGWGGYDFACMGFAVSGGHRFPWPEGCYVLRRRRIYPDVGEWTLCGTAPLDATSIKNGPGFDHQADMAYQYEVATVFGNGQASAFCEPVRVDFDGSVQLIDPLPMFPRNLRARPIAGGQFLVTWDYDPYGHGAWPKDFQVFGGPDAGEASLLRPQAIKIDRRNVLWVADALHHRICRFARDGRFLSSFGTAGEKPGELKYPYDLELCPDGTVLVCEYGNNRVQHFDANGHSLEVWGSVGRRPGELASPWGLALGKDRRVYVVDYLNHRVQMFRM